MWSNEERSDRKSKDKFSLNMDPDQGEFAAGSRICIKWSGQANGECVGKVGLVRYDTVRYTTMYSRVQYLNRRYSSIVGPPTTPTIEPYSYRVFLIIRKLCDGDQENRFDVVSESPHGMSQTN